MRTEVVVDDLNCPTSHDQPVYAEICIKPGPSEIGSSAVSYLSEELSQLEVPAIVKVAERSVLVELPIASIRAAKTDHSSGFKRCGLRGT